MCELFGDASNVELLCNGGVVEVKEQDKQLQPLIQNYVYGDSSAFGHMIWTGLKSEATAVQTGTSKLVQSGSITRTEAISLNSDNVFGGVEEIPVNQWPSDPMVFGSTSSLSSAFVDKLAPPLRPSLDGYCLRNFPSSSTSVPAGITIDQTAFVPPQHPLLSTSSAWFAGEGGIQNPWDLRSFSPIGSDDLVSSQNFPCMGILCDESLPAQIPCPSHSSFFNGLTGPQSVTGYRQQDCPKSLDDPPGWSSFGSHNDVVTSCHDVGFPSALSKVAHCDNNNNNNNNSRSSSNNRNNDGDTQGRFVHASMTQPCASMLHSNGPSYPHYRKMKPTTRSPHGVMAEIKIPLGPPRRMKFSLTRPHGNNFKMGQEASQLQSSNNLRHDIRLASLSNKPLEGDTRNNGWTSINGDAQHRQRPSVNIEVNGKLEKRKRSHDAGINGSTEDPSAREYASLGNSVQKHMPSVTGLGISLLSEADTTSLSSHGVGMHVASGKMRNENANGNGKSSGVDATQGGKDGRSDGEAALAKEGAESDVDNDAMGLLARVAAASSDEEEESASSSSSSRTQPRPIRPVGAAPVSHPTWRAVQPPIGTHYTIYSPNVQPPGYPPPRPTPETFDPNAPLSAHEEAQLRDEGRFTKMEQSFLKDAIDEYCKRHNVPVALANDYVCGKAREGNIPGDFWDEVCRALPQRTKNSIQRAAKRVFRNGQKKGPWTQEEEAALERAYQRTPDQWAKICDEVPGRSAEQCRDRWRNYTQNGAQLTRGPWTDAEENQFIEICKTMLQQARANRERARAEGRPVASKFIPFDHLNFTDISTQMQGKRSRLHCRNKWHKLKKRPDVEATIEAIVDGRQLPPSASTQTNGHVASQLAPLQMLSQSAMLSSSVRSTHPPAASQALTSLPPLSARQRPASSSKPETRVAVKSPAILPPLVSASSPIAPAVAPSPRLLSVPGLNSTLGGISYPSQSLPPPSQSAPLLMPKPALDFPSSHHTLPSTSSTTSAIHSDTQRARPLDEGTTKLAPITNIGTKDAYLRPSSPIVAALAKSAAPTKPNRFPVTLPPHAEARPSASPQASAISTGPPSWLNAPPRVPQLFPALSASATESQNYSDHYQALQTPRRSTVNQNFASHVALPGWSLGRKPGSISVPAGATISNGHGNTLDNLSIASGSVSPIDSEAKGGRPVRKKQRTLKANGGD